MNDLKVGIFSWNIGDIGDNSKIDNLLSSALNTYTDGYPDIFVFGFQEYHILPFKLNINDKTIFDNILGSINSKDKGKYKILDSSSACSQLSSFETMLLILIKTEYTSDKNTIIKKSECLSSTGSQTLLIGTKINMNSTDWLDTITAPERAHWESKPQEEKDWWYANTEPEARGGILRTEISLNARHNEFLHLPESRRVAILKRSSEAADAARERIRQRAAARKNEEEA